MSKIKRQESTILEQKIGIKNPAKTSAERSREYRARKKALKSSTDPDSMDSMPFNIQTETYQENSLSRLPKKPKTSVERSRECRARKKAIKMATDGKKSAPGLPKTPAERSREYRARKKALKNDLYISMGSTSIFVQPTHQENSPSCSLKTSVEMYHEYKARRKALENATDLLVSMGFSSINVQENSSLCLSKKAKTAAERNRECRARKRALKNVNNQENLPSHFRKKTKTPAQCSREYRARKKALRGLEQATSRTSPIKIVTSDNSCPIDQEHSILYTMLRKAS